LRLDGLDFSLKDSVGVVYFMNLGKGLAIFGISGLGRDEGRGGMMIHYGN
jgi:hypothetical protein